MGLMLAESGYHTRAFVEWEAYPRSVIIAAQRAGYFAPAPIWDDLTTFDAKPFAGAIDTLIAGYPCQPFSMAGKRLGEDDPRHLWPHVARVARELGDGLRWIFLENVAGHVSLGAETVLRELWDMGATPSTGIFSAGETGAPHERQRWFCVAYREGRGLGIVGDAAQPGRGRHADGSNVDVDDATSPRCDASGIGAGADSQGGQCLSGDRCDQMDHAIGDGRPARRDDDRQHVRQQPDPEGGVLADAIGSARHKGGSGRCGCCSGEDGQASVGAGGYRPPLFPPGPGDRDAWASVIQSAPHLAPSASVRDLFSRARSLEANGREWWEATAEPEFCRMVAGLANRTLPLKLLGNGVVPVQAAYAWQTLSAAHGLQPVTFGDE